MIKPKSCYISIYRWHNAVRQTHTPGVNMATAASKADTVKEELEDAESRVEQAKVSNVSKCLILTLVCSINYMK